MEYLDIVNDKDEVIGKASKKDIYQKCLMHRIVHVLIFNSEGKIALQLRTKNKSFPLHWSTSVGGHVQSGETYEQAAKREMEEEIGITTPVTYAYTDRYAKPTNKKIVKHLTTFTAVHPGPFILNPQEVEKIDFFSLTKIGEMIAQGENIHPELIFLLKKHFIV